MSENASGHGGSQDSSLPHSYPSASLWPLMVAASVAILGLSLFWAFERRQRGSHHSGRCRCSRAHGRFNGRHGESNRVRSDGKPRAP